MKLRYVVGISLIALFAALPVAPLGFARPPAVYADASCQLVSSGAANGHITIPVSVNAGDTVTVKVSIGTFIVIKLPVNVKISGNQATATGSGTGFVVTENSGGPYFYGITVCPAGSSLGGGTCPLFLDGRLNDCEAWETSAIYCLGDGSVRVYVIGQPMWTIDFDASPAEIARVPQHPRRNTVIKRGHFAALLRQTNGLLLVSSPGLNPVDGAYTFVFPACVLPGK